MEFASMNTVESDLLLYDQNRMCEVREAALNAVERMRRDHMDKAVIRPVVTQYELSRNYFGKWYMKVHTMDYAVWQIAWASSSLYLCSNGGVYCEIAYRTFWHKNVTHLMPVESPKRDFYDTLLRHINDMGVREPPRGSITLYDF